MANQCARFYLVLKVFFAMLASQAWAFTDPVDGNLLNPTLFLLDFIACYGVLLYDNGQILRNLAIISDYNVLNPSVDWSENKG